MMIRQLAALALALLVSACAYHQPASPTPVPAVVASPASITIATLSGVGSTAGQVFLTATVRDATGRGVGNVPITFSSSAGAFVSATVTADAGGLAQATLKQIDRTPITVTATAGSVTTSTNADVTLPFVPLPAPPPVVLPPPVPPPVPPPAPPVLALTLTCSAAPLATPSACNVTALLGSVPMTSQVAGVRWEWGDGNRTSTTAPYATHQYPIVGTFTAAATATMSDGSQVSSGVVRLTVN